jgi:hypothetical protein
VGLRSSRQTADRKRKDKDSTQGAQKRDRRDHKEEHRKSYQPTNGEKTGLKTERTRMEHGGHGEMKNAGWKPALRNRHDTFRLLPGICDIVPLQNKTPRPKSGRTFLHQIVYQRGSTLVKEKVSKNADFCKSLRDKEIREYWKCERRVASGKKT